MIKKQYTDRLIPPKKAKNKLEYLQAIRLVNSSFITSLFIFTCLICFWIIDFKKGTVCMIFAAPIFLIVPFLIRHKISLSTLSNIYIGLVLATIFYLSVHSGGSFSPIMSWLAIVPLLALFNVNKRASITWSLIVLFGLLILSYLEIHTITPINGISEPWLLPTSIFAIVTLLFVVFFVAVSFEANKNKVLGIFYRKNKELHHTLKRLEKTKKGLIESITQVKHQNDQLILQQKEIRSQAEKLKHLNDEKDYILEIIAHDLKEPLNSINGLLEIIVNDENKLSTGQKDCLDHIKKSTHKSKSLIKKILFSGQLGHTQIQVNWERTDLLNLLQNCLSEFNSIADQKNIKIEVNVEGNNFNTLTDNILLNQVISNIVSNSIKFSPKRSAVEIVVSRMERNIKFEFKDQGPGIREYEFDLLFEKYSRLSAKPTNGESSSGLGLSIVKRYVELLEGQIWVENNTTKGANFILLVPIKS